jgi:type II secretory ATPase GspE/PulE/Tfp pilus assembly ATPase PilB-like protein
MLMNSELRDMAFNRAPTNKIRRVAITSGMRTLLEDGRGKILDGITTLEEVVRTAQIEASAMA